MVEKTLDANILSLTGNHGNKNVMAASLLIKFPFVLWIIINYKSFVKIIGLAVLTIGIVALFIMNTRSTYVGLGLILFIFSIATIVMTGKSNIKKMLLQLSFFIGPIIIGFFIANTLLSNAIQMQDVQGGYGTVTKRMGDINVQSEQGSRIHLWKGAIDYATKHPIIGAGYGNWKLASIPYEKEFTNDLFVPYHCHNDFIEMFDDLGILGGVAFGCMFLLVPLFTFQIWRKKENSSYWLPATISFMAVSCYAVDALLNFPAERPAMQMMLVISAALVFMPIGYIKKPSKEINLFQKFLPLLFFTFSLALIVSSIYIAQQTYISLKIQKYVMGEIDSDPKMSLEEVKAGFPEIPNLSTSTLPIKGLIARYEFRDKHYEEALKLLKESEGVNPYLHYNDFIRTAVYVDKQKMDSVAFFAKRAFYNWPRATSYYSNMMFSAAKTKDSNEIKKAYQLYSKYRAGGVADAKYLLAMYEVKGFADKAMMDLLDSSKKRYPNDSIELEKVSNFFYKGGTVQGSSILNGITKNGLDAFVKKQYSKAADFYLQAIKMDPNNYTHYENVGICYYMNQNYSKAIPYFQKVIQYPNATSGKSEFYLAMCFIPLNNNKDACTALNSAKKKGYPGVDEYISKYCK
jgi:tetratricopeptide (TPR) repeat protein